MADIAITATDIEVPANMRIEAATADVDLDAGEFVYLDNSDAEWKLSDASASASAKVDAIVLRGALANEQAVVGYLSGDISIGSVLGSVGTQYVLSATAGKICLLSDLTTGDQIAIVGWARDASTLAFNRVYTGETAP